MTCNIKIGHKEYSVQSDDSYLKAVGSDFEPNMVSLFEEIIEKESIVYDIGANIGLTAILFSSLAKQVIAFEPSPSTYDILSKNLVNNGIENVIIHNIGFSNKQDKSTLTFAEGNRSGGFVSDQKRPIENHITENIELDTLDNFMNDNIGLIPTVLKIDVEGFERNVIQGGMNMLAAYKPTVIMEMNHFCLDVLHRITIPEFIEYMCSIFPYLYAVDTDNQSIKNLHDDFECYYVMHEHVVKNRFPNLVGGYSAKIIEQLRTLTKKYKKNFLSKDYTQNVPVNRYLTTGWSIPEEEFVWSDGKIATMEFFLQEELCNQSLQIILKGFPFIASAIRKQSYKVFVNDALIKEGFLLAQEHIEFDIPKTLTHQQELVVELHFPNCNSPKNQELSNDDRMLGFALKSIEFKILEGIVCHS